MLIFVGREEHEEAKKEVEKEEEEEQGELNKDGRGVVKQLKGR